MDNKTEKAMFFSAKTEKPTQKMAKTENSKTQRPLFKKIIMKI